MVNTKTRTSGIMGWFRDNIVGVIVAALIAGYFAQSAKIQSTHYADKDTQTKINTEILTNLETLNANCIEMQGDIAEVKADVKDNTKTIGGNSTRISVIETKIN